MSGFNWDNENKDVMEGYDTEPEPALAPVVAPPPSKQVDKVLKDLENPTMPAPPTAKPAAPANRPQPTEVEWRLSKAQFYQAVINSQLLTSDNDAAIEVENEIQEFAQKQLEILLGIRQVEPKGVPLGDVSMMLKQNQPFSDDEVSALKALAGKVLARAETPASTPQKIEPKAAAAPPKPAAAVVPATPRLPQTTPPAVKAVVAEAPTASTARRRGRPREIPCRICGQMDCEHAVKANKNVPTPAVPTSVIESQTQTPGATQNLGEHGVEVDAQGNRIVTAPNGIRYRMEKHQVKYKDGTIKIEEIPREIGRAKPQVGLPFPSPEVAMQLAVAEAGANAERMASNPVFQKMIDVAMSSEGKEYVPTDPRKK